MNQKDARVCIISHARRAEIFPAFWADPKEKETNETFAQGVTAVGRFGRYICIRGSSEESESVRTDAAMPSQSTELRRVVAER